MTNTIAQTFDRIGRHPAVLGTGAFLRWWRDQLVAGLPEKWRAHLQTDSARVVVTVGDEETVLTSGAGEELGRFPTGEEAAIAVPSVQATLARSEAARPEIIAVMPAGHLLQRTVTLPAATQDNLRQVLTFEMDRHTPFKADEVYFDYRVAETVAGGAKIRVILYLTPRADGERLLTFCAERGLRLHGIDAEGAGGERLGVNLLPPELREQRDLRQLKLNIILAVVFVVLLNVVLWQSVASREAAMDSYRDRLATIRAEAAEVIALRDELEETAKAASFLADKKRTSPPVLDLLRELSERLPDDTWLQRMQVNGDTVQISGQAPAAASLIALIEQSPCLEGPNIKGAVTPDPQTGNERFTIEAFIKPGGCLDGAASS